MFLEQIPTLISIQRKKLRAMFCFVRGVMRSSFVYLRFGSRHGLAWLLGWGSGLFRLIRRLGTFGRSTRSFWTGHLLVREALALLRDRNDLRTLACFAAQKSDRHFGRSRFSFSLFDGFE